QPSTFGPSRYRPAMPAMISTMQTMRAAVAGSLNRNMPSTAAPTAPIPVHAAYAVPTGRILTAMARSQKLNPAATMVTIDGASLVNPSEYFIPMAQTTSSRPAITRNVHAVVGVAAETMGHHSAKGSGGFARHQLSQMG